MSVRSKKVSVIMTTYNGEAYIEEAICSIRNQTYVNWELIIINDGSTDNTLNIIKRHAAIDTRIGYITRENKGRVYSLNEAISMSSGDYVAIMDSDDISFQTRLEKEVTFLNEHSDVFLVGTKFQMQFDCEPDEKDEKERLSVLKAENGEIDRSNLFESLNDSVRICHGTWMVRKEIYSIIGLYEECICEDSHFYFRVLCNGLKMDRLEEVEYIYRYHGESRSNQKEILKMATLDFKLEWLQKQVHFTEQSFRYVIWGSDFTGQYGADCLFEKFPQGKMIGYLDSFQEGKVGTVPVFLPEQIDFGQVDYIFICTNGGGTYARKYLNKKGLIYLKDYFKIA